MGNCLVTKLKGVVDNDNLPRYAAIKFSVTAPNKTVYIYLESTIGGYDFKSDIPVTITNYNDEIVNNLDNVYEGTIPGTGSYHIKVTNQTGNVYVKGKYILTKVGTGYRAINHEANAISFDVKQIEYSSIAAIQALDSDFYGTFDADKINSMAQFTMTNSLNLAADISSPKIANNTIQYIQVSRSKAFGNIALLSACTSLRGLEIAFTNCEGDVKTMVEGLVANGRTDTNLNVYAINGKLTYDGVVLNSNVVASLNGGLSETILTFEFSPSYPGGFRIKTA